MDKHTRDAANVLYGLLRAFRDVDPEELGNGVQDVPLVLSAVADGIRWLQKYEAMESGYEEEQVTTMPVEVVKTNNGLEFRFQGVVLAKTQVNQPAVNQINVVRLGNG